MKTDDCAGGNVNGTPCESIQSYATGIGIDPSDALHSEADIVVAATACDELRCGVYFLVHAGRVAYVGQSVDADARVRAHMKVRATRPFDSWAFMPCPAAEMAAVERAYIAALLPPYNNDVLTQRARAKSSACDLGELDIRAWARVMPSKPWWISRAEWDRKSLDEQQAIVDA